MYGLDLFSGIGGITRALDGYVLPVAYCEIDPYARGVLLSRIASGDLPAAPIWDDVTTLNGALLPPVDIIYGGFPCQDLSVAGRRKGLDGERSGLFFQICRLAAETKAPFIFLENVPGIRTKGLGRVIKELDKLGYDCRWGLLSAADVGANHKRERWFLLAHTRSTGWRAGLLCNSGNNGSTVSQRWSAIVTESSKVPPLVAEPDGKSVSRTEERGPERQEPHPFGATWWQSEPNVGRVAHGIPARVDRLRGLGNAVVPAQAREAFERLMGIK